MYWFDGQRKKIRLVYWWAEGGKREDTIEVWALSDTMRYASHIIESNMFNLFNSLI